MLQSILFIHSKVLFYYERLVVSLFHARPVLINPRPVFMIIKNVTPCRHSPPIYNLIIQCACVVYFLTARALLTPPLILPSLTILVIILFNPILISFKPIWLFSFGLPKTAVYVGAVERLCYWRVVVMRCGLVCSLHVVFHGVVVAWAAWGGVMVCILVGKVILVVEIMALVGMVRIRGDVMVVVSGVELYGLLF